ncbi:MAG: CysS/YqeB C-terminal domain-containing protein [Candidatus Limnocylindrales bacterium]
MTLRLRNTLRRAVEPVEPLAPPEPGHAPRVRIYTCGPTVYRWAHVGNLRTFLLADFIRRALLYRGLEVLHVKNITDVGHLRDERFDRGADRMLVAAHLEHKSTQEIADAYEAGFHADEARVNILPAHVFPRATEHIPEMLALAEALADAGYAYATPAGTVYYAVARFPDYGRLSGNSLEELRAGHRVEVEADKRDPADFALWKHAEEGRQLKWRSARWGEGYPGWHLECSAMGRRYLGERFEIHTGGIDNVFPHHEDEIAQSAPLTGQVPAAHWVHGEFLLMAGHKMAKSAGNFQRITELIDEGLDPLALRYLALTAHYSRKLNYSSASLTAAASALGSLRARLRALGPPPATGPWAAPQPLVAGEAAARPDGSAEGVAGHGRLADGQDPNPHFTVRDRAGEPAAPLSPAGRAVHGRFVAAVEDDLDLPAALAVVRETLKADLPPDERRWLVLDADAVLGLDLQRAWEVATAAPEGHDDASLPAGAARLLRERDRAREARDYERADALRVALAELGVEPLDRPHGPSAWRRTRSRDAP